MREIKFRAWHREMKEMFWFDLMWGSKHGSGSGWIAMLPIEETERNYGHDNRITIDPDNCDFMQFTGLKDKNGKEIYEGDVVAEEVETEYGKSIIKHEVTFNEGAFYPVCTQPSDSFEVIGNIYESTELLNKQLNL